MKQKLLKLFQKKEKKKKDKLKVKIKIKNDGKNDWPKKCVLCCNQNIDEINNYYFKDIEIHAGKEVKKGKEIKVEVPIIAKDKFNPYCDENIFFINYEVKYQGIKPLNKEKKGIIYIEYKN